MPFARLLVCLLVSLLLAARPHRARAQAFSDWAEGTAYLTGGDSLNGKIFLNIEADILQVEYQGGIKVYTPHQVVLIRFLDPPRLFTSLPYTLRGNMEVPTFFEIIYPGAFVTLLSRDRIGPNNAPIVDQYGQQIGSFYGNQNFKHDFFLLKANGRVRRLPPKRQDLAKVFDPNPPQALTDYIRKHRPDPTDQQDMVALVAFYNSLRGGQPGVK